MSPGIVLGLVLATSVLAGRAGAQSPAPEPASAPDRGRAGRPAAAEPRPRPPPTPPVGGARGAFARGAQREEGPRQRESMATNLATQIKKGARGPPGAPAGGTAAPAAGAAAG